MILVFCAIAVVVGLFLIAIAIRPAKVDERKFDLEQFRVGGFTPRREEKRNRVSYAPSPQPYPYAEPANPTQQLLDFGIDQIPDASPSSSHQSSYGDYSYGSSSSSSDCGSSSSSSDSGGGMCDGGSSGGSSD